MKIQIENKQKHYKISKREIRLTVTNLLQCLNCLDKEVSISFVDDLIIRELNNQYLGRNKPTNVLSFSLQEGEFSGINHHILGDIVISTETAERDAVKGRLTFSQEIDFLIIHGLLHLLGYNHENTSREEAKKMQNMEKLLFKIIYPHDQI
jgi:probable rRNA maturation factor